MRNNKQNNSWLLWMTHTKPDNLNASLSSTLILNKYYNYFGNNIAESREEGKDSAAK